MVATLKNASSPYQRGKRSTLQIMLELTAALLVVWLFGVIYSFVEGGSYYGVHAILNMVVALAVTVVCDVVTALCEHKKGGNYKDEILHKIVHNYSYVTAIIFVLTLPAWTPYYVTILGSIFATVVVKNFFGGFGKNVFNPAALARVLVTVCFQSTISASASNLEVIASGTVTSLINNSVHWISFESLLPSGYTLSQVFLGTYFGALGETSTLLILLVGIFLSIRKDINWRTPTFYLGTVFLTSLLVALVLNIKNPFGYSLMHICLGGVAFGAVFMLTDPVTGPTSNFGKALNGVIAGLLTMLIRFTPSSSYPEGVVFSIALCNMISPVIDYLTKGKTNKKQGFHYGFVFGGMIVAMCLNLGIAYSSNDGRNVYSIRGKELAYFEQEEYKSLVEGIGIELENKYYIERETQPEDHPTYELSEKELSYFNASENYMEGLKADLASFKNDLTFVEEEGLAKSYSIYSNKDRFVGYAYHMCLSNQTIDYGYEPAIVKFKAWVVVEFQGKSSVIMKVNADEDGIPAFSTKYFTIVEGMLAGIGGETSGEDYANVADATYSSNIIRRFINAANCQAYVDRKGGK